MNSIYKTNNMQWIHDEETDIVIINGYNERIADTQLLAIPLVLVHRANKIIQVYIDENNTCRFHYIKNRFGSLGEFTPTREERDYIFEQLIGI